MRLRRVTCTLKDALIPIRGPTSRFPLAVRPGPYQLMTVPTPCGLPPRCAMDSPATTRDESWVPCDLTMLREQVTRAGRGQETRSPEIPSQEANPSCRALHAMSGVGIDLIVIVAAIAVSRPRPAHAPRGALPAAQPLRRGSQAAPLTPVAAAGPTGPASATRAGRSCRPGPRKSPATSRPRRPVGRARAPPWHLGP